MFIQEVSLSQAYRMGRIDYTWRKDLLSPETEGTGTGAKAESGQGLT